MSHGKNSREMKTKSPVNRKVQLAFGSAILALLMVGAISYRGMVISNESDRWVRHTHEVLESLQNLLFAIQGVESSYRGFALTGNDFYIESYRASILGTEQDETTVRNLTADNPEQQRQLPALKRLAAQKIQFGEKVISLRRTIGLEAAADAIRSGAGQRIMEEFRGAVRGMQSEELRLLVLRDADATRRLGQTKTGLILGTVLGLLIAAAAGWSTQRDNSRRGHAEEALWGSEEKYRTLLDGIQEYAIFMLDPRGQVASWNAGAERIKGYKADEIIGQNFSRFYLQKDIDQGKPEEELQIAAATGRSEAEHWRVRKDGSRFWAKVVITAVRNSSGSLLGFSEISRDNSERKETEAKYRGLLEAAPDAIVVVNQGGEIVLLNVQAEKQFGYHRDELVGQQVKNIIPEGFAERLIADGTRTAAEALAQQIGTGTELRGRRKDGSEFPIEIMLSPLDSAEGILVTAAIRDVTARKTAEKALREAEERFRALANNISQLAWMADEKGYIFWYNQRWFDYTGTTFEEMAGWGWQKVHHPDHVQQVVTKIRKCFQTGEVWEDTFPLRGRHSNYRWFLSRAVPIRDSEGKVSRWFGTNTDITERKESEEQLVKAVEELKRSNDELQQFAYVASHDLQEPLRMVASYTQLLAQRYKGRLDSDADEFIAYAVDGANRMQGLIQDLLAYSRAGANGKPLRKISSEYALKEALKNLRVTVEESGAVVTHDSLPAITTDDTQLAQVFQNLVGNAIKYRSAEVPHIHVSATKNGGNEWIFSVRDNGLGIDPQYFDRIFVLFQRLHGREEFKGTGIGLAICKKMLERLGGRIWVESQPEKGSTFCFTLPERDRK
jgi:PAS domain S-box-containing protein